MQILDPGFEVRLGGPAFPPDRSGVLGPCEAQDLRCLCRDGLARRARGAGKNRPTVGCRGQHSRAQSGRAPGSPAAALGADSGRPEGLPRSAADQDQRQERARAQELSLRRLRRTRPPSRYVHVIETARLNDVDSEAWLAPVIARIADHPINRVDPAALELVSDPSSAQGSPVSLRGRPITLTLEDHLRSKKKTRRGGVEKRCDYRVQ